MLGKKESLCLDAFTDFIKNNPGFRPMTLGEVHQLFRGLDSKRTFLLLKGSFGSTDCALAILLNYDVSSMSSLGSTISIFYRVYCETPVDVTFVRETSSDRVTKQIGLTVEVQVNNPVIDDKYLIHSNNRDGVAEIIGDRALFSFLEKNSQELEKFEVTSYGIEYQRMAPLDLSSSSWIEEDLKNMTTIAEGLEKIKARRKEKKSENNGESLEE